MIGHANDTKYDKTADQWKLERLMLDRWRRDLTEIDVDLKRPKIVDPLVASSASGEPSDGDGSETRFRGQIVYFTDETVTVRRPAGAIIVLENDEISSLSDGKERLEL